MRRAEHEHRPWPLTGWGTDLLLMRAIIAKIDPIVYAATLPVRIVVPVTSRHDEGQTLQAYMRLPVSQYVLIEV